MLAGKKILIGITGSIAAYKIPYLVRLLIKEGAEVKVIMTTEAKKFVSPLTLSTLSKNAILTDLSENNSWTNHVMMGRWADVMLVAPLTCNTLAKMANGLCDNLLMAVYLSAVCPVITVPAMDEDMWLHVSTKHNLLKTESYGNRTISVGSGELASGLTGEGRMAEPEAILQWLNNFFLTSQQLKGKKALVTAGPTYEAIDPVRFIGNHSSGKMGVAIAKELADRGAAVTLVLGPSSVKPPVNVNTVRVVSAKNMFDACMTGFENADITIMSAAVADYTPVLIANEKIKKQTKVFSVELERTSDILKHMGSMKKPHQLLIGFALETNNERVYALQKLQEKNADMIILNSLQDTGAGFGHDTNKITIFDRQGGEYPFTAKTKQEVAVDIINTILQFKK